LTQFQSQFKIARRAGVPLLVIRSADTLSTIPSIRNSFNGNAESIPLVSWDFMRGLTGLNESGKTAVSGILNGGDPAMVSRRPTDMLELASNLPEDSVLFVMNFHLFWTDGPTLQGVLNLRDKYKSSGIMFLALVGTGSVIPAELTEQVLVLDEPLPVSSELAAIVRETADNAKKTMPEFPELTEDQVTSAVDGVTGLCGYSAEQSLSLAISKSGLDISEVWKRKRQMISEIPGLSVWSGKQRFSDLGGIEQFKNYTSAVFRGNESPKIAVFMDELEKAIVTDSGNSTKSEIVGILLSWFQDVEADCLLMVGVPGAGKSEGVKAIGNEFSVPVISCNIAAMQDQFVGNSVKNVRRALATINAMSNGRPCVFATCNKLESLSAELRRRFTLGTMFFDLPTDEERVNIWEIYLAKYSLPEQPKPIDSGWTGAEIKECCRKAYRLNLSLLDSAKYIVPVSRSSAETIKTLRLQASGKFLSASESGIYRYEETATVSGRKLRD
jgi:hypothetical protein